MFLFCNRWFQNFMWKPPSVICGDGCVLPLILFSYFSWFFENVSRKEAEKLLLAEENPRGTFLVRPSEHNPNGYSLSVKDWEEIREYHVKHYKIKPLDNGGFYISTNKTFLTLVELVNAYTSKYLFNKLQSPDG